LPNMMTDFSHVAVVSLCTLKESCFIAKKYQGTIMMSLTNQKCILFSSISADQRRTYGE